MVTLNNHRFEMPGPSPRSRLADVEGGEIRNIYGISDRVELTRRETFLCGFLAFEKLAREESADDRRTFWRDWCNILRPHFEGMQDWWIADVSETLKAAGLVDRAAEFLRNRWF